MNERVNVLVLAGQREGVKDELCAAHNIAWKALLPIRGQSMIEYVRDALFKVPFFKSPFYVSGIDRELLPGTWRQSPSAGGPASSVLKAAEAGLPYPFLVTTCDHPLLTPKMLEAFISGAQESGADFALGLASKDVIQPAYPDVKRTYLKFKGHAVSGCNLFYIKNETGLGAIRFWQAAQNDRKKPWKLASHAGFGMLSKYISGGLTLEMAFETISKRLNLIAKPILLPFAEAAIDVDKPSDFDLVDAILAKR